ncbi:hypothetical protein ASPACDRAFT_47534 [Aspergillus aculeatus ATCC 16872]|uniref:Uncharacterized protein n=1 Tax=Aspergillus aculeatus (strain ATCC 16872 / CBS 172.66 / WB 5094) TaxID=690307 RepID=A0A1L9WHH8_ASPA1|nr:uncharacterized protein ASPACDRAFT_47534 [Aspergillus aculeatus ATCC 16872]OJJ95644.1 hypothetical protein ASPACDRAFT_47534 [Aspergillus aculeatus ATCC 16872]
MPLRSSYYRSNAATSLRLCALADIDIAVAEITPHVSGSVAFDVLFHVARSLCSVIGLYRPGTGDLVSGLDLGFPDDSAHLYHATAILSHRLKTFTSLPAPAPSHFRQQLSSFQVIRCMRDPARLTGFEDARQDFDTACDVLQTLRRTWASADAMASLEYRTFTALIELPSLDVLRVNRNGRTEPQPSDIDTRLTDPTQATGSVDRPVEALSSVMDLFAGMNDVSWMFLDAGNPTDLSSLPLGDI